MPAPNLFKIVHGCHLYINLNHPIVNEFAILNRLQSISLPFAIENEHTFLCFWDDEPESYDYYVDEEDLEFGYTLQLISNLSYNVKQSLRWTEAKSLKFQREILKNYLLFIYDHKNKNLDELGFNEWRVRAIQMFSITHSNCTVSYQNAEHVALMNELTSIAHQVTENTKLYTGEDFAETRNRFSLIFNTSIIDFYKENKDKFSFGLIDPWRYGNEFYIQAVWQTLFKSTFNLPENMEISNKRCSFCNSLGINDSFTRVNTRDICNVCLSQNYRQTLDGWESIYRNLEETADINSWNARIDVTPWLTNSEKKFFNRTTWNPPLLGIEIELEAPGRDQTIFNRCANLTSQILGNFGLVKGDGSLDYGFEIVSVPATFETHQTSERWKRFFDSIVPDTMLSKRADTTGIHVHISKNAITPLQLIKMIKFTNFPDNRNFINGIAGRSSSRWSKFTYTQEGEFKRPLINPIGDRYVAVNLQPSHTVEWRIFKSDCSVEGVFKCLGFVNSLWEYTKFSSLKDFTWLTYWQWLNANQDRRSKYKHLISAIKKLTYVNREIAKMEAA